jgi:hypothetical protein
MQNEPARRSNAAVAENLYRFRRQKQPHRRGFDITGEIAMIERSLSLRNHHDDFRRDACRLGWALVAALVVLGAERVHAQDEKLAKEFHHVFKDNPPIPDEIVLPDAKYAHEYYHSFKGNPRMPEGWGYQGPANAESVRFERDGLHIVLPAGWDGERPLTGIRTEFGAKGDFEITMSFEILQGPDPEDSDRAGTRITLAAVKDTPTKGTAKSELATVARSVSSRTGHVFVNWARRSNPAAEKPITHYKAFPTTARAARLRLVRSGPTIFYLKAEGDEPFRALSKWNYGAEDLYCVQIVGATGSDKAMLDARVSDIRIRADALLGAPVTGPAPVTQPVAADPGAAPNMVENIAERGWLLTALLVGLAIVAVFSAGGAVIWLLRQRQRAPEPLAASASATVQSMVVAVAVSCGRCGKKLRAKRELAGKKVKCPNCGTGVPVPAATDSGFRV